MPHKIFRKQPLDFRLIGMTSFADFRHSRAGGNPVTLMRYISKSNFYKQTLSAIQ
jgi:hypothetical protein